jgi:hypothetical protein
VLCTALLLSGMMPSTPESAFAGDVSAWGSFYTSEKAGTYDF